jgi:heat shock protein HslJ
MRVLVVPMAFLLTGCASHAPSPSPQVSSSLRGTTWRLVDLAGAAPLTDVAATLSFPEEGRIAGGGSCNRFFGSAKVTGEALEIAGVGSTKMACPEPIMGQEQRYLEALQGATRYAIEGNTLSIWVKGSERPLRFARQEP